MQSRFSLLLEEREVSHAEQQRMWGALRSSCIHIYRPYGESLIGLINKHSAAFERQQHILSRSMRSKLRFKGSFFKAWLCGSTYAQQCPAHNQGACPLMGLFWVFGCDFSMMCSVAGSPLHRDEWVRIRPAWSLVYWTREQQRACSVV